MGKHTPEPWAVHQDASGDVFISSAVTSFHIAEVGSEDDETVFADASRIVACVNACAGLPQEALDGGWSATGISAYAADLEKQVRHFQERLAVFQAQFSMAKDLIHDLRTPVETGLHNAKVMRCELGVEKRQDELRRIENILSWKESD
ncbi:hypothetical protein [Aeromonas sp. SCS5]|uniref:hypothetical protein n=1 Tax=Aeromonas sp. SCS5 TaxID=1519205 RepID=UPI0009033FBF|nr:hypothetical protein [Aeromonas sp. SCS5]